MSHGRVALFACLCAAVLASARPALAQRTGRISQEDSKSAVSLKNLFTESVRAGSKSTVVVRVQKDGVLKPAALGTVITADGYVLTKGSEVLGYSMVTVQVHNGSATQDLDAKLVGYSESLDLAMLKVAAKNLTPAVLADTRPPATQPATAPATAPATTPATAPATAPARGGRGGGRGRGGDNGGPIPVVATVQAIPAGAVRVDVGEWVATTEAGGSFAGELYPKSIGVISTPRRAIDITPGYLGLNLADTYEWNLGARIMVVIPNSNAERAGLKRDDVITSIGDKVTKNRAAVLDVLHARSRGEIVTLNLLRDEKPIIIRVELGDDPIPDVEEQEMLILSGDVNRRSGDFPAVFQHDSIIKPQECGGPLVDLEGRIIGINIARAGRTETYAIPADLITPLIEPMKSGKMPPPADFVSH